eukprot:1156994-Pelagomonas_calceolata.AAC.13
MGIWRVIGAPGVAKFYEACSDQHLKKVVLFYIRLTHALMPKKSHLLSSLRTARMSTGGAKIGARPDLQAQEARCQRFEHVSIRTKEKTFSQGRTAYKDELDLQCIPMVITEMSTCISLDRTAYELNEQYICPVPSPITIHFTTVLSCQHS